MLLSNSTSNGACPNANMEKNAKDQTSSSMAALKCPRCNSSNTKFCYYNNYSLSQPRHFCKACKRYWTRGGTLRNVPIGGGCRKNKRLKKPTITTTITTAAATTTTTHPSSSSSSSALLSCHPPPPPPPPPVPTPPTCSLPLISSNNMDHFNIHYANLPPLPAFLQQPQLEGFNLGYPSNAHTNHDQQQHLFDPLLGSSLSTATAASLLLSSIKQQQQQQEQQQPPMMLSCDNLQSCHEDGNLGLGFVKQVKMEAEHQHHHPHHHHHHHAWMQAPCGNLFETIPAANTSTVGDSPSANLFWSWNQSIGPLI